MADDELDQSPEQQAVDADGVRQVAYIVGLAAAVFFIVLPRLSPFAGLNDWINDVNVFRRLGEWTIEKTESLFADHGYWVVFVAVVLENSAFIGLLVPGSIVLILGGLAAENGSINIALVLLLGVIATIIGDTISYMSGRLGWARVFQRGAVGDALERMREPVESNSKWLILAYHFAGYSRVVGPMAAGLFRLPFRKWAPIDYAGGALWVLTFTAIGYVMGLLGVEFGDTKRMVQLVELMVLAMLVVGIYFSVGRMMRGTGASAGGTRAQAPVVVPVEVDDQ